MLDTVQNVTTSRIDFVEKKNTYQLWFTIFLEWGSGSNKVSAEAVF